MSSQYKRKIKVVTIKQSFYELFSENHEIMRIMGQEAKDRPCLILLKMKYKGNLHTFAIPFRSNIGNAPSNTYFPLPKRAKTKDRRKHGLHYSKMFPITEKYMLAYHMGGDFQEELVMAYIERNIKQIYSEAAQYLKNYETGQHELFCVDIDDVLIKLNYQ
ncbi:hypothetical protein [Dielma fastidiosa]|uniref:Uncharacterized protein n=1 Tax=Dielma fastidiosa TaxID=1034346 RepID=A0A318L8T2_9FIRM|nr:hypothetical protein [Dielma fastidiosa]PXX78107.1 hypothetical protein DES51_10832 [Dielma fastidiosa]